MKIIYKPRKKGNVPNMLISDVVRKYTFKINKLNTK